MRPSLLSVALLIQGALQVINADFWGKAMVKRVEYTLWSSVPPFFRRPNGSGRWNSTTGYLLGNGGNWWDQASIALPSTPVQKLHPTPCWFLSSKKFSASWNGLMGPCCQDGLGRKPACKSSTWQKSCISRCVFFPLRKWWITAVFPRRSAFLPRLLPLPAFNTFQDPAINDVFKSKRHANLCLGGFKPPRNPLPKVALDTKDIPQEPCFLPPPEDCGAYEQTLQKSALPFWRLKKRILRKIRTASAIDLGLLEIDLRL